MPAHADISRVLSARCVVLTVSRYESDYTWSAKGKIQLDPPVRVATLFSV